MAWVIRWHQQKRCTKYRAKSLTILPATFGISFKDPCFLGRKFRIPMFYLWFAKVSQNEPKKWVFLSSSKFLFRWEQRTAVISRLYNKNRVTLKGSVKKRQSTWWPRWGLITPPRSLTARPWKMVVGRRSFPFGARPIFMSYVKLREGTGLVGEFSFRFFGGNKNTNEPLEWFEHLKIFRRLWTNTRRTGTHPEKTNLYQQAISSRGFRIHSWRTRGELLLPGVRYRGGGGVVVFLEFWVDKHMWLP